MRPRPAKAREMERIVLRLGFLPVRTRGSHRFYRHPDGRIVTIPFHPGDIPTGTLRAILVQVGLSVEAFNQLR